MSPMITRCPACATQFRVVPDQLRISQGWVRCGQCAEIFDAEQALLEPDGSASTTSVPAPALVQTPAPETDAWPDTQLLPADAELARDAGPGPEEPVPEPEPTLVDVAPQWLPHSPPEIPVTDPAASLDVGFAEYQQALAADAPAPHDDETPAHDAQQDTVWMPELQRPSADRPDAAPLPSAEPAVVAAGPDRLVIAIAPDSAPLPLRTESSGASMPLPKRATAAAPPPELPPSRVVASPPVDPAHAELSFLRDTPAVAEPLRPVVRPRRSWWTAAAPALVLLLAWQLLVHERDRIAASAPALRPLLQGLCAPLGCSVQPLRRIDAIVIDGSSFHARGDEGYRLSLTLRNRAPHAVALPAVVLALTDISEQPVVRRVLLPDELGTPPAALQPHGEWTANVDLQMADNAGRARVVGYRLDAFYP